MKGVKAVGEVVTIRVNGRDRALLTIPEALEVLNVGRSNLYKLMGGNEPELRSVRVGKKLRLIPAESVLRYLEGLRQAGDTVVYPQRG